MPEYLIRERAVGPDAVEALRKSFLDSPLVDRSTLAGSFRGSKGFALTFTSTGITAVCDRFPSLTPLLDAVIGDREALLSLTHRVLRRPVPPGANAFYLNLLLLPAGASVGRHTDATLRGPAGVPSATPQRVTVLYLRVPEGTGGRLQLFRDDRRVAAIRPREGALLHFRGDLQHEVTAVASTHAEALRASLVCEQYHFDDAALARLPSLQVHSKAPFARHLDAWRQTQEP